MDRLTPFTYEAKNTPLHRLDARVKVLLLFTLGFFTLGSRLDIFFMAGLSTLLLWGLWAARISILGVLFSLRVFFVLVFFGAFAKAFTSSSPPYLYGTYELFSLYGVHCGLYFAWRLCVLALMGHALTATTRASELEKAVAWFFSPFFFLPRERIAFMMGLSIRFLPLIFKTAKQTMEAQVSRGADNLKNPVRRLRAYVPSLMQRVFFRANMLTEALKSRCYSENRTKKTYPPAYKHWGVYMLVVFFLAALKYL